MNLPRNVKIKQIFNMLTKADRQKITIITLFQISLNILDLLGLKITRFPSLR